MPELIICEKPSVAAKISDALADKKPLKKNYKKVFYYELTCKNKKVYVVCAVGHLYTVAEKNKKAWTYPVFDVEWVPSYEINKSSLFTKDYLDAIKLVAKKTDSFVVACDWDVEGEVIGYNILKHVCNKRDAKRMNYSTTTKDDLLNSYLNISPHLDKGLVESGLTRHVMDYYYGINLSRALTLAIKNSTGMFKILSSGRVQGPALKILSDRELEIRNFKPEPFWQIELETKEVPSAWHSLDKIKDKKKADNILKKTKNKPAIISKISKTQFQQKQPHPFDLTALQLEAYRTLRINPKDSLSIAQELYTSSYISYPRTSSNQIPSAINIKKILKDLSKQTSYKALADDLLSKPSLNPNNGIKKDPAHPAVYPTGVIPKRLGKRSQDLYDLIVRRFLATFGDPAVRETGIIEIDVNKETFIAKGTRTINPGWHVFYGRFAKFEEQELPKVTENQRLNVKKIIRHDKETQPPKRYTPASIIKELEKKTLGTKATRSSIVDSLYQRDYVKEQSMEVTDLGLKTISTLKKYSPDILDENLTRHFENEMESISERKKKGEKVLAEAQKVLVKILKNFKENELKIGKALSQAYKETMEQASIVGKCPNCKKDLRILYSKKNKSYFVACSGYPKCKTTFSLPYGLPKPTKKLCPSCNNPVVRIIRKGKRPYDFCINKECPKKEEWLNNHS